MVLKIKEREEAIQLLAMDPQVCGKLLTHHRKGSKVDEEALHDRFPLRQSTGKGLQIGSRKNRGLRRRKGFLFCLSVGLGIFVNLQRRNQVKRCHEGPTSLGGMPTPLGAPPELVAPSWLFWSSPEPSRVPLGLEKSNPKFFLHLDFV